MKPAKFQFILQTHQSSGRMSQAILAETESRDRAYQIRNRITAAGDEITAPRKSKPVKILSVDPKRFAVFRPNATPPEKGQLFESVIHLAKALDANPVSVRAAISHAKKVPGAKAIVRGVVYAYAE